MKNYVFINGRFLDANTAKISVSDRGFLYGDGLFETMRSYTGVIFRPDMHIARLYSGLKNVGIKEPCTRKDMAGFLHRSLCINKLKNAYIRLAVTRGEGRFGITYKDEFKPNLVIVAKDFEGYPEWMYERGIRAKIAAKIRQNERSPISQVKTMNFLPYILARFEAKEAGFDEAILLNTKSHVSEASTSNVFVVKKNILITPSVDSGIIPGITRRVIIDIVRRLRMRVIERCITCDELKGADEVFLTNSLAEVIPVVKIDSRRIGHGKPGDITKLLHISYQKEVIRAVVF